ncbi:MAG TPA: RNase H family protein, partial [Acetobacteraceae bacterium]|nr:RNase H family protein [Acetobacteraceae bacterium]
AVAHHRFAPHPSDDLSRLRMLITLFTDASYCSRFRIGAYAAWAKADGRTVRHSGVLKQAVASSSLAETMALVNGIFVALAAMRPPTASKIIAQTDCLTAIHALSGMLRKAATIKQYEPVVAAYRGKIAAAGIAVEFRHVSGHKGTVTPRNAVNTWCDAECRRLLRAARETARERKTAAAARPVE